MKILVKGNNITEVVESKSELTKDKLLTCLDSLNLLITRPEDNVWFEYLQQGISVYKPKHFKCTLQPLN